jgi:hypothetical protein
MNPAFPVQITFHGVRRSEAVEELVHAQVADLTRFHPRIHGCRVVISPAEGHAHAGGFHVQVRVAIPGNDVVVGHQQEHGRPHEDMAVAVSDALRAAGRMLEDDRARVTDHRR